MRAVGIAVSRSRHIAIVLAPSPVTAARMRTRSVRIPSPTTGRTAGEAPSVLQASLRRRLPSQCSLEAAPRLDIHRNAMGPVGTATSRSSREKLSNASSCHGFLNRPGMFRFPSDSPPPLRGVVGFVSRFSRTSAKLISRRFFQSRGWRSSSRRQPRSSFAGR